jgi:hypothetical protein
VVARAYFKTTGAECLQCGVVFLSRLRADMPSGRAVYCSRACGNAARRLPDASCPECGVLFRPKSRVGGKLQIYCTQACETKHTLGPNSPSWKGGLHTRKDDGSVLATFRREGFKSPSVRVHRLICAKALGRPLTRDEMVLHINRDSSDNREDNLFVCESRSEMERRVQGVTLTWPEKSNLATYGGGVTWLYDSSKPPSQRFSVR